MKILSIETSCDETAVSIIEADGGLQDPNGPSFTVLSNLVLSQIKIHEKYGGVFPNLAKREHAKNLAPLLKKAFEEAGFLNSAQKDLRSRGPRLNKFLKEKIEKELSREPELFTALVEFLESVAKPKIDLIAVTFGPGLEPALWVGINAAKVLGEVWDIPIMPINHMEGHISSVLFGLKSPVEFPAIALLISGGHTELVLVSDWISYKIIGQTRDDAVGEAYDKVARMLGLPYPGGPQIASLAEKAREEWKERKERGEREALENSSQETPATRESRFNFPRPMLKSGDLDFSFSGLKTSVLYAIRKISVGKISSMNISAPSSPADMHSSPATESKMDKETKKEIAMAFEDAVVETLVVKTRKAMVDHTPRSIIVAGGVIANKTIRLAFEGLVSEFPDTKLLIPTHGLSTDNALMIALAAYVRYVKKSSTEFPSIGAGADIKAQGNARLSY
ncbi:MAG: tRNA (adenosine(37)-N6)-threonylcarbamoyltransferase complex transferase subunit TsaD [Patescibacteria group bacterium]